MNTSSFLSSHGMSVEGAVTLSDFTFLCPALLNQIDGGACILHGDATQHRERGTRHPITTSQNLTETGIIQFSCFLVPDHKHQHGYHGDHNHSNHDHSEHAGGDGGRNIATGET